MPRYVIERNLPGAGDLSQAEMNDLAKKNCSILNSIGTQIQWVETFVTENKLYCIYIAPDKSLIMHHADFLGLPANRIEEIKAVINPATPEETARRNAR